MICVFCGRDIPADVLKKRHYTNEQLRTRPICCNKVCSDARRSAIGQFKAMSAAGKTARGEAVTRSNSEKPRRAKRT